MVIRLVTALFSKVTASSITPAHSRWSVARMGFIMSCRAMGRFEKFMVMKGRSKSTI